MAVSVDESVPLHSITVADSFAMGEAGVFSEDERLQLLRGVEVEPMTEAPAHADVVAWLTMALVPRAIGAGLVVRPGLDPRPDGYGRVDVVGDDGVLVCVDAAAMGPIAVADLLDGDF